MTLIFENPNHSFVGEYNVQGRAIICHRSLKYDKKDNSISFMYKHRSLFRVLVLCISRNIKSGENDENSFTPWLRDLRVVGHCVLLYTELLSLYELFFQLIIFTHNVKISSCLSCDNGTWYTSSKSYRFILHV